MELSHAELEDILQFSKDIARQAGALILKGSLAVTSQQHSDSVNQKKNSVDLVTEWDLKVETFVKSELLRKYPSFLLFVTSVYTCQ